MRLAVILIVLSACVVFSAAGPGICQEKTNPQSQEPKVEVSYKEVSGRVSGLSPSFIAVLYGNDEKTKTSLEAAFKLDPDVRVVHKNSFKEIKAGDIVSVGFDETRKTFANGKTSRSTKVRQVIFLQPAPKKMMSEEPAKPQEAVSAPAESAAPDSPLPLKGLKGR